MKIKTWIEPDSYEAEVEVGLEDIRNALKESPETSNEAFFLLNRCGLCMKSVSNKIIDGMTDMQRMVIKEFLIEQSTRYFN